MIYIRSCIRRETRFSQLLIFQKPFNGSLGREGVIPDIISISSTTRPFGSPRLNLGFIDGLAVERYCRPL